MSVEQIRALYDRERDEAFEQARQRVAGPEPSPQDFRSATISKYPLYVILIVYFLCFVILVAAFIPSANRLFIAGSTEFCKTIDAQIDLDPRCDAVGIATVILAETGQIVFLLALAVLNAQTPYTFRIGKFEFRIPVNSTILYVSMMLSTCIAIIGNIHVSQPWLYGNWLFGYFDTLVPPLLVMGTGFVLKELMLHSIESRHQMMVEFELAKTRRSELLKDPESAGREWLKAFSLALRDQIRRVNSRKTAREVLDLLTAEDWQFLIKREMLAAQWVVDPNELTRHEKDELTRTARELETTLTQTTPATSSDEIWENADGTWTAQSKKTGLLLGTTYKLSLIHI